MKTVILLIGVLGTVLYAQAPIGSSTGLGIVNVACATPDPNYDFLCGTATGIQQSVAGAPYTALGTKGDKGDPGPSGGLSNNGDCTMKIVKANTDGSLAVHITCP